MGCQVCGHKRATSDGLSLDAHTGVYFYGLHPWPINGCFRLEWLLTAHLTKIAMWVCFAKCVLFSWVGRKQMRVQDMKGVLLWPGGSERLGVCMVGMVCSCPNCLFLVGPQTDACGWDSSCVYSCVLASRPHPTNGCVRSLVNFTLRWGHNRICQVCSKFYLHPGRTHRKPKKPTKPLIQKKVSWQRPLMSTQKATKACLETSRT